jgi:hypothetical protein
LGKELPNPEGFDPAGDHGVLCAPVEGDVPEIVSVPAVDVKVLASPIVDAPIIR